MDNLLAKIPITCQKVLLISADRQANKALSELMARLALRGTVVILDGGNSFDAYLVARSIRRLSVELEEAMDRLRLARAFTCYQMLELLAQTEATPDPKIVLDLLTTFRDDAPNLGERMRILRGCLDHLERLSSLAPVLISIRPPRPGQAEDQVSFDLVREAAEHVLLFQEQLPAPQLRLF